MAIVLGQPGVAIDWDWADQLTLWSSDRDRIGKRVGSYRMSCRPVYEHHATAQARRWWGMRPNGPAGDPADDVGPALEGQ